MKYMFGLFIAIFAILNVVYGYPAYEDGDDEVEIVPLDAYHNQNGGLGNKRINDEYENFDGTIDTGYHPLFVRPYPYLPWNWNFSGFFDSVEDIFRNMRDQVANRFAGEDGDFGKGNTTSKVEIVDGHKITINTTSYVKDTGYGKSVINVRTIDVAPIANETVNATPAVTKTSNDDKVKVESKIDADDKPSSPADAKSNKEESIETLDKDEVDNEIVGDIDEPQQQHVEIFIDGHQPQNYLHSSRLNLNYPENDVDGGQYKYQYRPATWESTETSDEINNEIETDLLFDDENPKPIDLANDIAINDILAAQGAPIHPDAEVFAIEEIPIEPMAVSSGSARTYQLPKFQFSRFEKIKK